MPILLQILLTTGFVWCLVFIYFNIKEIQRLQDKLMQTKESYLDYDGENIKSKIIYYSPKPELDRKIKFIQFMGYLEPDENRTPVVELEIRFNDGKMKQFPIKVKENGWFDDDSFINALKEADKYLDNLK